MVLLGLVALLREGPRLFLTDGWFWLLFVIRVGAWALNAKMADCAAAARRAGAWR